MATQEEKEAHHFVQQVCRGDRAALVFCDLWYKYCHAIDDLIDTREDGRPTMSAEQTIEIFAVAAMLYNCPFYIAHRDMLFSIVLSITNAFADSVAWEKDPLPRRRTMADVLRTCGDDMFFMVAMITGGYAHMRALSPQIRERDWVLQHDEHDQPN